MSLDLVGLREVGQICAVGSSTPYSWSSKGLLPPPGWVVSGSPIWERHVIEAWNRQRLQKMAARRRLSDPAAKVAGHHSTEQ